MSIGLVDLIIIVFIFLGAIIGFKNGVIKETTIYGICAFLNVQYMVDAVQKCAK